MDEPTTSGLFISNALNNLAKSVDRLTNYVGSLQRALEDGLREVSISIVVAGALIAVGIIGREFVVEWLGKRRVAASTNVPTQDRRSRS